MSMSSASMVFGGISGSALADLAGLGTMVIQAMARAGYRAEFSAALMVSVLAAGADPATIDHVHHLLPC